MAILKYSLLPILALAAAGAFAQQDVGTLSIVRQVKVTTTPVFEGLNYVDARNGQRIKNNYGIRTLRRSEAQVKFFEGSILRVNERTDVTIQNTATLRKFQLNQGAVWVKVAGGVNTTVATPTATATARGTEFEVLSNGEVIVYEGSVVVQPADGGPAIIVGAGEKVELGANGSYGQPQPQLPGERPIGRGGASETWFNTAESELGTLVGTAGADYGKQRTSPLNDPIKTPTTGDLTVVVRGVRYPAASLAVDPRRDLGLLDDTNTSYLFPLAALAGSLLEDRNDLTPFQKPAVSATVFGFTGDPAFAGVRGEAVGVLGGSRYGYEADVLQYFNDPQSDLLGRFGSVLYLERSLSDQLDIYAGRKKFYLGPVFEDAIDTQLVADRYTAAGAKFRKGALTVEGAYLYDGNRYSVGTQPGYLGSVTYKLYGGILSGQVLETTGTPGGGHGHTVGLTLPVVKHFVDGYGEFGTGVDGTTNETAGVYLPWVLQQTGVDFFFEYARKRDVAQDYSIVALYSFKKGPQFRGSIDWVDGTARASLGAALKF